MNISIDSCIPPLLSTGLGLKMKSLLSSVLVKRDRAYREVGKIFPFLVRFDDYEGFLP